MERKAGNEFSRNRGNREHIEIKSKTQIGARLLMDGFISKNSITEMNGGALALFEHESEVAVLLYVWEKSDSSILHILQSKEFWLGKAICRKAEEIKVQIRISEKMELRQ